MRVAPSGLVQRQARHPSTSGAAAAVVLAAALGGCAEAEAVPSTSDEPATSLSITMREVEGRGDRSAFTLTCEPVGGDLPTRIAACANLAGAADPFAPVPATTQCLQMIEGPGLISVNGVWDGAAVKAQFSQINSCETDRFDQLLQTLGVS